MPLALVEHTTGKRRSYVLPALFFITAISLLASISPKLDSPNSLSTPLAPTKCLSMAFKHRLGASKEGGLPLYKKYFTDERFLL